MPRRAGSRRDAAQARVRLACVIVNGPVVLDNGRMTGARASGGIQRVNSSTKTR